PALRRSLTLLDLTMIAVGSTIGSGIFLTPAIVAQAVPSPMWILGLWILGGITALSGALTFAELGGIMPRAGGVYVFLTEAYGGLAGFLYGWAYFLVVNTGGIAALAIAFATYLNVLIPLGTNGVMIAAIAGIALVTLVNVLGVKAGGIFSDIFTALKLLGILFILAVGFGWGSFSTTDFAQPLITSGGGITGALTIAMVGILWSYGGWQHATFTAAEALRPERDVPRALIIGAGIVVVAYLLINVAYFLLLSPAKIASSPHVASDAVSSVLGPAGSTLIALVIFLSTFGTAGIYTLTAPRIYFAMANDGVFFRQVTRVHPRYQTPYVAILLQSGWAIALVFLWGTFERLISYVVFTDWIFFAMTAASVFVFRRKLPTAERPYRTTGYPVTPAIFLAIALLFVLNTLLERPAESGAGLLFLALGVPVYYFWKKGGITAS
ncbi:MAG: amino acid permease, partial [Bacteroidetes bacterium]|nr:amino acid permease [Bacteroidota bacterium]